MLKEPPCLDLEFYPQVKATEEEQYPTTKAKRLRLLDMEAQDELED